MSEKAGRVAGPRASKRVPGRGRAPMRSAFGLLMIVIALAVLWRYESRTAANARELTEIGGDFVQVSPDGVDPKNEGKLVHVTAPAISAGVLRDPETGFSAVALAFERVVEVYQWQETRQVVRQTPGEPLEVTTAYREDWFRGRIDSSRFAEPEGHENPPQLTLQSQRFDAEIVSMGDFQLPLLLTSRVALALEYPLTDEDFQKMSIHFDERARLVDGRIFIGDNVEEPAIGDMRVSYHLAPSPFPISIVAQQVGRSFGPYQTRTGRIIMEISRGTVAGSAMVGGTREPWERLWLIRLTTFVGGLLGLSLLVATPSILTDVLPAISRLAGTGFGLALLLAGLALTLTTIAMAWIPFRPLIGVALLGGAACAVMFAHRWVGRNRVLR